MAIQTLELNLTRSALIPATDFHLELHGIRCSFCGLGKGQVERLFEGRSRYICNECIRICMLLIADYRDNDYAPPWHRTPWYWRWRRNNSNRPISCSFCGAERIKGEYILAGRHSQICERCVRACESLVVDSFTRI
ncbi:MAG TPA: ClpX C4-type zinc finger protein [Blastocatellia bacterium]|nr:ClpX C4-type zinc finger protein [Blastocatellia bacterium]